MPSAGELRVHLTAQDDASGPIDALGSKLGGLGAMAAVGAAGVGVAIAGGMAVGVKSAGDLQQAVANISTIKPEIDTSQVFGALNQMSTRIPQSASQLGDALYDVFSSMDVTQDKALEMVESFAQGATAAGTDTKTFGTAIMGSMNAYKDSLTDASHASDVFFNTVNKGVVTGAELAAGMGPALASAKAMGVDYETAMAMIAGATKEGGPAAQNINNMTNLFNKLGTTDAQKHIKALGITVTDAAGDFRAPLDVLGDLKTNLEGMTESARTAYLQKIFPDAQARQGAQVVMSQLDMVRDTLALNRESTGSTASAYEKMSRTFNSQTKLMQNSGMAILTTLGAAILPSITPLIGGIADALEGAMPAIKGFADGLTTTLTNVVSGFSEGGLEGGTENLLQMLGMTEEGAAGVTNFFKGMVDNLQQIIGGFQNGGLAAGGANIIQSMLGLDEETTGEIMTQIQTVMDAVGGAFNSLSHIFAGGDVQGGMLQFATILNDAFGPEVSANVIGFVQTVKDGLDGFMATVRGVVSAFQEGGWTAALTAAFGPEISTLVQVFAASVQGFFEALVPVIRDQVLPALGEFASFMGPVLGTALQVFATMIGVTVVAGIAVFSAALFAATGVIENAGPAFSILGGLADLWKQIMMLAAKGVGEAFDELGTNINTAKTNIGRAFSELGTNANTMQTSVGAAFSAIGKAADTLHTNVAYALMQMANSATNAMSNLGQAIRDGINGIAAWVGGLAGGIGKNLVQGFIDGMDSLLGGARAKVTELGNIAAEALRIKLKEESPSKVTYQYGQWFVEGFTDGITDWTSGAVTAAQDLARDTSNAFADSMRQFNAQWSFDFMDQRDFDHWQGTKKTLQNMPNLLLAPTGPSVNVPQPTQQKIQDDMMTALNASNRGPSAPVVVNVGLDSFDSHTDARVNLNTGRSTDRAGRLARSGFGRV